MPLASSSAVLRIGCVLATLILAGCAPTRPTAFGDRYLGSLDPAGASSPVARHTDTLEADLLLGWKAGDEAGSLDGLLRHAPGRYGRLDLRAPLGIPAAMLAWDSLGWQLYLPREELMLSGPGHSLPEGLLAGFGEIDLEMLAGWSGGELLPAGWQGATRNRAADSTTSGITKSPSTGDTARNAPATLLSWRTLAGDSCVALVAANGEVQWLEQPERGLRTSFKDYSAHGDRVLPTRIRIQRDEQFLQVQPREVRSHAKWDAEKIGLEAPEGTRFRWIPGRVFPVTPSVQPKSDREPPTAPTTQIVPIVPEVPIVPIVSESVPATN
jgi:hypothetical protein